MVGSRTRPSSSISSVKSQELRTESDSLESDLFSRPSVPPAPSCTMPAALAWPGPALCCPQVSALAPPARTPSVLWAWPALLTSALSTSITAHKGPAGGPSLKCSVPVTSQHPFPSSGFLEEFVCKSSASAHASFAPVFTDPVWDVLSPPHHVQTCQHPASGHTHTRVSVRGAARTDRAPDLRGEHVVRMAGGVGTLSRACRSPARWECGKNQDYAIVFISSTNKQ